jgi:hypothetical protein
MSIRVGRGRIAIVISGPIADGIERDVRQILGPVVEVMDQAADEVYTESIEPKWPIKTGKSLKAWTKGLQVMPGTWEVSVEWRNPLTYTRYIKSTKEGRRSDVRRIRSPLQQDAMKPARKKTRDIKPLLVDALAKSITEALNG